MTPSSVRIYFWLLSDLTEMIWLVDFSSASSQSNPKPTESEVALLAKTAGFKDFMAEFTDKCLTLIENCSREQTSSDTSTTDVMNEEETAIDCSVTDVFLRILSRCSSELVEVALNKLKKYIPSKILEPTVAATILSSMVKGLVQVVSVDLNSTKCMIFIDNFL